MFINVYSENLSNQQKKGTLSNLCHPNAAEVAAGIASRPNMAPLGITFFLLKQRSYLPNLHSMCSYGSMLYMAPIEGCLRSLLNLKLFNQHLQAFAATGGPIYRPAGGTSATGSGVLRPSETSHIARLGTKKKASRIGFILVVFQYGICQLMLSYNSILERKHANCKYTFR